MSDLIEQFKLILSNSDDAMDLILWFWMSMLGFSLFECWLDDFLKK